MRATIDNIICRSQSINLPTDQHDGPESTLIVIVMKRLLMLCWMLGLASSLAQAQPIGFLRAKNARIVNDRGEEIILRGMGLGGWMLQEIGRASCRERV